MFDRAKLFNFNEVQLINLFFHDHAVGGATKRSVPHPRSSRFSPMLSFQGFVVFHFTFRSVIPFKLILVKVVKSASRFFFFFFFCM